MSLHLRPVLTPPAIRKQIEGLALFEEIEFPSNYFNSISNITSIMKHASSTTADPVRYTVRRKWEETRGVQIVTVKRVRPFPFFSTPDELKIKQLKTIFEAMVVDEAYIMDRFLFSVSQEAIAALPEKVFNLSFLHDTHVKNSLRIVRLS